MILLKRVIDIKMRKNNLRIGIIGCGAVVEKFHLPAISKVKNVKITAFIDKDIKRAKKLSADKKDAFIGSNYKDITSKIDIALIALPHFLHAPVSITFLKHRVHVFCEKPMALIPSEAKEMIKIADLNHVKLGIGMMRRHFTVYGKITEIIQTNYLGSVKSFDYEEGFPYDWPIQSKFIFDKKQAGGGVLIDMGAHAVDLIVYLFGQFGNIKITDYFDDSHGGVEANCNLNLKIDKIKGRLELSNDRRLRNTFIIRFTKGYLEIPSGSLTDLVISKNGKKEIFSTSENFIDAFYKQMNYFIDSINTNSSNYVSGTDAYPSIELINFCYKNINQFYEPWYTI